MEWLWFMLPVAAACGWIAGYRAKKRKVRDRENTTNYYQGLNYLLNHQPDRALDVFMRLVENDPETLDTHFALASLFRQRGEVEKATKIHQNLIARPSLDNYQRALALLELGRDYLGAGLNDRAENLLSELLDDKNHANEAIESLLEIYQKEKDWEKAIEITKRFKQKDSATINHMIAHFYCEMGEQSAGKGNYSRAIARAKKAEATEKNGLRSKILLGDIAMQQARYIDAVHEYVKVINLNSYLLSELLERFRQCIDASNQDPMVKEAIFKALAKLNELPAIKGLVTFIADYDNVDAAEKYLSRILNSGKVTATILSEWLKFKVDYLTISQMDIEQTKDYLTKLEDNDFDYACHHCGYKSKQHYWQCPSCKSWDTISIKTN